jgi:hypothetical protein
MTSKKLHLILVLSFILLVLGIGGGTYAANNLLQTASTDLVKKRAEIIKLEQEQSSLVSARKDIQEYETLSGIAKSIVPQDKDQAQTVREIVNIAAENDISLGSITFPTSTLGEAEAKKGSTTSPTKKSTNPKSTALSQLVPVKEIPGVYSLQIVVTSNAEKPVPYSKFIAFLDDLEHNRRTALVSDISINPDKANRSNIGFTLTLDEYIKP